MWTHFRYLGFKNFQWYKELFNPMSFDPWNTFLKIWNSIGILTPKVGVHLGVCGFIPSHSQECKCDSWVEFAAHTFPCLYHGCEPKPKVMTKSILKHNNLFWVFFKHVFFQIDFI